MLKEEVGRGGEGEAEAESGLTHEYLTAALIFMPAKLVSRSPADKGTTFSISTSFCKAGYFLEEESERRICPSDDGAGGRGGRRSLRTKQSSLSYVDESLNAQQPGERERER